MILAVVLITLRSPFFIINIAFLIQEPQLESQVGFASIGGPLGGSAIGMAILLSISGAMFEL